MLEQFRVARYQFTIEAFEELHLPPFKGSTLRGGFGHALRKITCLHQDSRRCRECGHQQDCVYGYLFRTRPPKDADVLSTLTAIARPFVIEPPQGDNRRVIPPGEQLDFTVVLIGRAIEHLPYFILAFKKLGKLGLGARRGKYMLQRVLARHPWNGEEETIFDGVDVRVGDDRWIVHFPGVTERAQALPTDRLDVAFLTPTRLKHRGELMWEGPPFHVLVRRLLDRVSSLAYFHCGERWEIDFRGWIERAKEIRIADAATTWADWSRYSGRQDRRIKMGGLVGPVAYEGDLAPYRALLALGSLIHVGKGTVMGNGRMALKGLDKAGMM
jgi:hypothetical protein